MVRKVTDMKSVRALFEGWEETMIWSCLQGIMGAVYADYQAGQELPQSAMAVLGDFVFLAGKPSEELLLFYPQTGSPEENHSEAEGLSKEVIPEREKTGWFQILVPRSRAWERLIEKVYESEFQSENMKKITRYAIKKEPEIWKTASRRKKLEKIAAALPEEYELRLIDQKLYDQCMQQEWSRDLVSQFSDYEIYQKWGIGTAVLHGKELVCGASSYSRYLKGIEIEIDTKEAYRRRGLARVCAARLILECLDRGLYPSWDAHTEISAELAEKLGYHRGEAYTAYLMMGEL